MKTYEVIYRVSGYFTTVVEAESAAEAEAAVSKEIDESCFGPLTDIDWENVTTELVSDGEE